MATEALTLVAQRADQGRVSKKQSPGHEQSWRQILIEEDADAIWRKLFTIIKSVIPDGEADCDKVTQEVFLHLLATGRLSLYINQEFSDKEIEQDLLSIANR